MKMIMMKKKFLENNKMLNLNSNKDNDKNENKNKNKNKSFFQLET